MPESRSRSSSPLVLVAVVGALAAAPGDPAAAAAAPAPLCLTPEAPGWSSPEPFGGFFGPSAADCDDDSTNPDPFYDPGEGYLVDVWVHVIEHSNGDGQVSDELVRSQIAILNEDFRALPGSHGSGGQSAAIYFRLVGVDRSVNDLWYADEGDYWETLAVDPFHVLNLYTTDADGARGYVPFTPTAAPPGSPPVGTSADRVVINWLVFGRGAPFPPHDEGRTATHEVGHYFGLKHTFFGDCGTADPPGCNATGDTICDTPPDQTSVDLCPVGATSCGGHPVPIENYMQYTDDLCMTGFTLEQRRRARCVLRWFRSTLGVPVLFFDDFETGSTASWSSAVP